jgi:Zn-dependent protease with chaperone function
MADPDYSILSGFQGQIVRPRTSFFYHVGLVLVAATMLLLPLLYFAMVGTVAYTVYHHATHNFGPIMRTGGVNSVYIILGKLLIYFVPLLAGLVVVFFMFKPLLAGRPKHAQPLALNPASERLLYAFIEKICDVVGAPSPKRIDLDCQLNAAAHFRRGFFSMFGNDLVLVLGLPLVANLTARELAGIIAHEFGHFTQSAGMRLSYTINSVNSWFARVAYQRDAWDEALETWSTETQDAWVAFVVMIVQLAVWFSRLILKILMLFGLIVTGFMQRQKEYNADAYQIKLVGSECFEKNMRKLAMLGAAWEETRKHLLASWKHNRTLPDNLPQLIRHAHQRLPASVLQAIDDTLGFHRTGLFDFHPSPADRIRQARKANDPGIFHDDRPASSLFTSFEHPSRFVTLLHYTDDIGIPINENMLTHVELEQDGATGGGGNPSYFLGLLPLMKPIRLGLPLPSTKMDADYLELNELVSSLRHIAPQVEGFSDQDEDLLDQLISKRAAHILLNNGFALPADTFSLPKMNLAAAATAETEAAAARRQLRHSLREVMPTLNRRLQLGIGLALAKVGESSTQESDNLQITELANWINDNAGIYLQRQELTEALLTMWKIQEVKAKEGENPAMRRAVATAEQTVSTLAEKLFPPAEPQPAASGSRLQIAKNSADFAIIRRQNHDWLRAYDKKLKDLVKLVERAENFTLA